MKRIISVAILLALVFLLAGCASLPEDLKGLEETLPARIEKIKGGVDGQEKVFQKATKDANWSFFAPYAARENWSGSFKTARTSLGSAETIYTKELQPILKDNRPEDEVKARAVLARIDASLAEAKTASNKPAERMKFLTSVKQSAPKMVKTAEASAKSSGVIWAALVTLHESTAKQFPAKETDLKNRFAAPGKLNNDAQASYKTAKAELDKDAPDYAVLGDSCVAVDKNLGGLRDQQIALRKKTGELSRDYSKTLVDMKVDHYVTIARADWSEALEGDGNEYVFKPVLTDQEAYAYFEGLGETEFDLEAGFFGGGNIVDKTHWNKLGLNPDENQSYDSRVFWVDDTPMKFYHKYLVTENGVSRDGDWEEVTEEVFDANEDNLNMDLIVKPYGYYEEEVLKAAAPAGMSYVGNTHYGEWQKDATGNNFWVFYGQYRLFSDLLGGSPIYRNDWNTWNTGYRGRKAYYGSGNDDERYGTYGHTSSSTVARSTWSRTGGVGYERPSVRGAGPAGRAGGPAGGGK